MRKRGIVILGVVCVLAMAVAASAVEPEVVKQDEKAAAKSEKAGKGAKGAKGQKGATAAKGVKADEGWISLFNGKDLTGWKAEGKADWKVADGMLVGKQGPNNAPGDLFTEQSFSDFELTCTYKCTWPCNTGVWFRYQTPKKAYQADILEYKKPEAYSGTLYSPGYPGGGQTFMAVNLDKKIEKRDDWNTIKVTANGDHIVIELNGKKTVDVRDKHIADGKIGFQVHPGAEFGPMSITVKEIKLRPLKGEK